MMDVFWIWPVLILGGLAVLGYLAYQLFHAREVTAPTNATSSARRLLDERYARGEIDDEEYRTRREQLP